MVRGLPESCQKPGRHTRSCCSFIISLLAPAHPNACLDLLILSLQSMPNHETSPVRVGSRVFLTHARERTLRLRTRVGLTPGRIERPSFYAASVIADLADGRGSRPSSAACRRGSSTSRRCTHRPQTRPSRSVRGSRRSSNPRRLPGPRCSCGCCRGPWTRWT